MQKLLVPTDFSTCANNAVEFAVQSAKLIPVEITLFHSFELSGTVYTDYMGVINEFNQTMLDDVHNKLAELKQSIADAEGVVVNTYVAVTPLTNAVLQATEELGIDMVVMGTLGAGPVQEKLWGSKTAALIGRTKVPLMVIPFYYQWKKPEKFLLATNHFEEPTVLEFLFQLADLFAAQVHIVVMTDEDNDKAEAFLEHARRTPVYEKDLRKQFSKETLTATLLYGKVFKASLQEHLTENNIDILAMITYQKETGFWDRLFHPSMTKTMSYSTEIPLLVIPRH